MSGSDESVAQVEDLGGALGGATPNVSRETPNVSRETPNVSRETPNVSRETWAYIEPANPGYWVCWSGGVRWVSDEEQARWIAGQIESGTPPGLGCFFLRSGEAA